MSMFQGYNIQDNPETAQPPRSVDEMPHVGVWKREPKPDKPDELTKVPYNPVTGRKARPNDPRTFGTRQQAEQAFTTGAYSGLCFLVTGDLGVTAGDLDHIIPEDQAFDESAIPSTVWRLIRVANTYTSWSPSGTGLRFYFASVVDGYMTKTPADAAIQAEQYYRLHYMTETFRQISGTPDTFNSDPGDLEAWITMLGFQKREQKAERTSERVAPVLNLDDREVVEMLSRVLGSKFTSLYENGDTSAHGGDASRADLGLMNYLAWGTGGDTSQMERLFTSSEPGQRDKWGKRADYRKLTIDKALEGRSSSDFYDPRFRTLEAAEAAPGPRVATASVDELTCDEVRAELKMALQTIAADKMLIASQAKMIQYERSRLKDIEAILATPEVDVGARAVGVGLYLEVANQERLGRERTERGYQIPAAWIAGRTGQTVKTANKHIKTLAEKGIIAREVVNLTKGEDAIDNDTGEIFTVDVPRKVGFIATSPEAIVTNFTEYKRNADAEKEKHGGKREPLPHCKKHPNAGTITHTVIECRECHEELRYGRTEQEPEDIFGHESPTPHHGLFDDGDLAATGTDDGAPIMGSPTSSVVTRKDVPIMGSPPPTPFRPDPTLTERFAAGGWE